MQTRSQIREAEITVAARNGRLSEVKQHLKDDRAENCELSLDNIFVAAMSFYQEEVARFLLEQGADVKANYNYSMERLIEKRKFDLVPLLVKSGEDINFKSKRGSALSQAVDTYSKSNAVEMLIDLGADIYESEFHSNLKSIAPGNTL